MELLDHMVIFPSLIWETSVLFSTVAVPIYSPTSGRWGGGPFFPHPPQHLFLVFLVVALLTGLRRHLWFWFTLPWWLVMWNIFPCACWPSIFYGKKFLQFLYFLIGLFVWCRVAGVLCIFCILTSTVYVICKCLLWFSWGTEPFLFSQGKKFFLYF